MTDLPKEFMQEIENVIADEVERQVAELNENYHENMKIITKLKSDNQLLVAKNSMLHSQLRNETYKSLPMKEVDEQINKWYKKMEESTNTYDNTSTQAMQRITGMIYGANTIKKILLREDE